MFTFKRIVLASLALSLVTGPLMQAGTVAEWNFDEIAGGTEIKDQVGGLDGAIDGTVTLVPSHAGVPGATGFGNACHNLGNSLSSHIRMGNTATTGAISNFGTSPFSIAGWFNANFPSEGFDRWVIGNIGSSGGFVVHLRREGDSRNAGKLYVSVGTDATQVTVRSHVRLDDGEWHWFAATSDGSVLKLYIDGAYADSVPYLPETTATPDPGTTAFISRAFEGQIDQLTIWDNELTGVLDGGNMLTGGDLYDLWQQSLPPRDSRIGQSKPGGDKIGGKIITREVTAFDGEKGWTHNGVTYRLACGVNVVETPNGDILVTWLSGTDSEPSTDNCILAARSTDGGWTWSEPWIMVPAGKEAGGLTNLFKGDDNQLVALGASWPSEDEYTTWYYFRMESRDDGRTWSAREPFTLFDNHACLARHIKLDDGQWLFPASIFTKRDKPLHGDFEHLAKAHTEEEAQALAGKFPDPNPDKFSRYLHGCMAFQSDDMARVLRPGWTVGNRPMGLLEPSLVQLKDGTVVMLMRAQVGGFLWESRSYDRGKTWTPAVETSIPNPSVLAFVTRLRDGRIALFNNPTGGKVGAYGPRNPLEMWISDDEMQSWPVRHTLASGAKCAYPAAIETESGRLLVVYDRDRRFVRLIHIGFGEDPLPPEHAGKKFSINTGSAH